MDKQECVYFVSDAHIGLKYGKHKEREKALLSFFQKIREDATHLIIVGDLFDFWIEYKHSIRADFFPILHELQRLRDAGVQIDYVAGNHDFAIGSFLPSQMGISVHIGHWQTELSGRKLHLHHGHGLLKGSYKSRILDKILRNSLCQGLYKSLLHPTLGIALGDILSKWSKIQEGKALYPEKKLLAYRKYAKGLLDQGSDIVIFGHTHFPELNKFPGDKWFVNTGEWIHSYTYARLHQGQIYLLKFSPPNSSTPLPVRLVNTL